MTSADVVAILLRRWYVVLAGLAMTASAIFFCAERPGVYSTQTDVLFLIPTSAKNPNPVAAGSESLIATAGLVARIVSEGQIDPSTASSGVTLTGEGIRQGYSIRLPNSGGQWANNFDRPVLDIQVAGPSEAWVRATLTVQIASINDSLRSLQEADGTGKENFIFTSATPAKPKIVYSNGEPKRAIAAIFVLGMTLTGLAAVGFERLVQRRHPSTRATRPKRTESV